MVKCENEKCKELVARKNLEKHLQSECEYRKMKCRHCEEEITVTDEKVWRHYHSTQISITLYFSSIDL